MSTNTFTNVFSKEAVFTAFTMAVMKATEAFAAMPPSDPCGGTDPCPHNRDSGDTWWPAVVAFGGFASVAVTVACCYAKKCGFFSTENRASETGYHQANNSNDQANSPA